MVLYIFLVCKVEDATLKREYAIVVFVDIGAFNWAPFQKLWNAAREHSGDDSLVKWIYVMLMQRLMCAEVRVDRSLITGATEGCQGVVL